jgi:hypothetical protein
MNSTWKVVELVLNLVAELVITAFGKTASTLKVWSVVVSNSLPARSVNAPACTPIIKSPEVRELLVRGSVAALAPFAIEGEPLVQEVDAPEI